MKAMDLAKHADVTYRQIDHWTNRGWLQAEGPVGGLCHLREYPPAEVKVAVWMAELVAVGFKPHIAARMARGDKQARMRALNALTDGWLEESA